MGAAASLPTASLSSTLARSASQDSTEQGECLPLVARLPLTSPYTVPPRLWRRTHLWSLHSLLHRGSWGSSSALRVARSKRRPPHPAGLHGPLTRACPRPPWSPCPLLTGAFPHNCFHAPGFLPQTFHPSSLPSVTYQTASVPFICEAHWHKFHMPQTQEPMPPPTQILGPSSSNLSPKWWFISRFSDHCTGD